MSLSGLFSAFILEISFFIFSTSCSPTPSGKTLAPLVITLLVFSGYFIANSNPVLPPSLQPRMFIFLNFKVSANAFTSSANFL